MAIVGISSSIRFAIHDDFGLIFFVCMFVLQRLLLADFYLADLDLDLDLLERHREDYLGAWFPDLQGAYWVM
jgi:hypothetical protein